MKTLDSKNYQYLGQFQGWYVFQCTKKNFTKEVLFLEEARVVEDDGSSTFYNSRKPDSNDIQLMLKGDLSRYNRMKAYSEAISKSTSIKQYITVRRNPNEEKLDVTTQSVPTVNHNNSFAQYVACRQ